MSIRWLPPPAEVEQGGTMVPLGKLLGGNTDGLRDFSLVREGSSAPVTGAFWLPKGAEVGPKTPLLLCGHGGSGHRYQQLADV